MENLRQPHLLVRILSGEKMHPFLIVILTLIEEINYECNKLMRHSDNIHQNQYSEPEPEPE